VNKKKQKNFISLGWRELAAHAAAQTDKSFLLLFFKKEDFRFLCNYLIFYKNR